MSEDHTVIDTAADLQAAPVQVGRLVSGPALTAFNLGVHEDDPPLQGPRFCRTLVGMPAPLHLPAPIDDETVVVDVEDL